jgi:hypothetical protein
MSVAIDLEEVLAKRPRAEFEVSLTDEDVALFHERGFITLPRVSTDEELEWLRGLYDLLFGEVFLNTRSGRFDLVRPYDSAGEDLLPQIITPEARCPQLKETAFYRNGRKLASQLMGVEESGLQGWGHMIRKPARVGEALPWHQDEAYWDPEFDYRALGSWMPLDEASIASGCMSFIPGSHRSEILPHKHVGDDPMVHALFTEPPKAAIDTAIAAPVPAGGAVLHHCRILHSSGPNVSDHVRRAWANEWQFPPVKRETAVERPWREESRRVWAEKIPSKTKA